MSWTGFLRLRCPHYSYSMNHAKVLPDLLLYRDSCFLLLFFLEPGNILSFLWKTIFHSRLSTENSIYLCFDTGSIITQLNLFLWLLKDLNTCSRLLLKTCSFSNVTLVVACGLQIHVNIRWQSKVTVGFLASHCWKQISLTQTDQLAEWEHCRRD